MHRNARTLLTTLGLLALATAGCELIDELRPPHPGGGGPGPAPVPPPQACTLIGCQDQLNVTVTPTGGNFAAGVHVVTAELPSPVAATILKCEFSYAPGPGVTTAPVAKCTPGMRVNVFQKQSCTTVMRGDAVGRVCEPVAGQFEQQIVIEGTPQQVTLSQTVNGSHILQETLVPTYAESRPNGPKCEPVCRQATVELTSR